MRIPKIGDRVRLIEAVDLYPIGIFEIGLTGTVAELDLPHVGYVMLDAYYPVLREWDNALQVWPNGSDESPCTWSCFEFLNEES